MTTTENSRADALTETKLPDGSGFAVASLPLPHDHWLYEGRSAEWDSERDTSADTPHPILTHAHRDAVVAAVRYAVRGATMCGKEADFDPDALVLNAVYALCGPHGRIIEDVPTWKRDIQKVIDSLDPEDWCGDESMISVLERALAASPVEQPAAAPIARNDPAAVTRLKAICRKLGLESAFPDEVYSNPEGLFAIFGQIRSAIDRLARSAPSPIVLHALRAAKQFIANGVELGYIRMPDSDCPDPAHEVPNLIDAAISSLNTVPSPADERAAWDRTRHSLAVAMCGFATRSGSRDLDAAISVLDAITEAESPLSWLRSARAASANETGAEGARPRNRSAEWGGYLATNVERLIEAVNALHELEMREDDGEEVSEDDLQHARETLSEYMGAVRSSIYDFHRRTKQDSDEAACRSPAMAVEKLTNLPSYLPSHALRGLYKPADEYFIDGKPCTPEEYISWQAGIIEAVTKAKLPDPKYYGGSAEEGDQHDVKCAYADGWNDCRASILAAPQPAQADARVGLMDAVVAAAKTVVREELDSVSVHPCDEHDDEVRARQLPDHMQKLYRALLATPQPEPRAELEAAAADKRDAERWRKLNSELHAQGRFGVYSDGWLDEQSIETKIDAALAQRQGEE